MRMEIEMTNEMTETQPEVEEGFEERQKNHLLNGRILAAGLLLKAAQKLMEDPDNPQYAAEVYDNIGAFVEFQLRLNPNYGDRYVREENHPAGH